jgi:hypothetical protein
MFSFVVIFASESSFAISRAGRGSGAQRERLTNLTQTAFCGVRPYSVNAFFLVEGIYVIP